MMGYVVLLLILSTIAFKLFADYRVEQRRSAELKARRLEIDALIAQVKRGRDNGDS